MNKLLITLVFFASHNGKAVSQSRTVFANNVTFTIPSGWYIKDSSATRIMLRLTNDVYSKIEIKIYPHSEKDLLKYQALDRKKFMPDAHTRAILPDAKLGGYTYKKVKYVTNNNVLKVNTDMEYVILFRPKMPMTKVTIARLEVINTYALGSEATMLRSSDALVASVKLNSL